MKRVRSEDLKILIAIYYSMFLDPEHNPINDIIADHGDIKIDINSVYIEIYNIDGEGFETDGQGMGNFERAIEDVTFGNLKVTYKDDSCIHIANSYEVAEVNW